jgi:hypothetical protein
MFYYVSIVDKAVPHNKKAAADAAAFLNEKT